MIRRLIIKELQEHWLPLSALVAVSFTGLFLVTLGSIVTEEAGNVLGALRSFLLTFGLPIALVISNRLVVREYQGKTQLFLESLPLTRARMIAVKYALGLVVMAGFVAVSLVMLLPVAAHRQPLTARFVEIVALRALVFTFLVYAYFFATGMLGRYRMAIYALTLVGLVVLTMTTDLELARFGPFALMNQTFPFEWDAFPVEPLLMAFGLGAAFSVLAFALALTREGSTAAMLAEKMSHREKMFVAAMLLGLMFLGGIFGKKPEKQPFAMPGAIVRHSPHATVSVDPGRDEDLEAARALASQVDKDIDGVVEYLGLKNSPPVYVAARRDLDPNLYERGELLNSEGVLARANFAAGGFDVDRFRMWLIREFVVTATDQRAELESKSWVLDGLGPFWINGHRAAPATDGLLSDRRLALRALYGTGAGTETRQTSLAAADLRNWRSFRERFGEGVAAGVAWSGLDVLSRHQGPERTRQFLQAVLASPAPKDVRALAFEWQNGVDVQLERIAGVPASRFLTMWREELDAARSALQADLARLPRLDGALLFAPLSPETRTAQYRVAFEPAPAADAPRVTLLHADLSGFSASVAPQELQREDIDVIHASSGELDGTWSRGARVYWTFSAEVTDLGCDVISGWKSQDIE
ncbi:MAG TPA: hypothetical protein VFY29_10415 [Terriglobia bacterium]|nr:hypothetical protein [Terriglobia bacterium]